MIKQETEPKWRAYLSSELSSSEAIVTRQSLECENEARSFFEGLHVGLLVVALFTKELTVIETGRRPRRRSQGQFMESSHDFGIAHWTMNLGGPGSRRQLPFSGARQRRRSQVRLMERQFETGH
jgi:hypothetical protein